MDQGQDVQIDKVVSPMAAGEETTDSVNSKLLTVDAAPASPAYALLSPVFPDSGESSPKLIIDENVVAETSSAVVAAVGELKDAATDKAKGDGDITVATADALQATLVKVAEALTSESALCSCRCNGCRYSKQR
jgi:hypothetical protein